MHFLNFFGRNQFTASSVTLTFAFYQLALNQDIQEKARDSVNEILSKYDGEWCYDALIEMSYLEQIVEGKECSIKF